MSLRVVHDMSSLLIEDFDVETKLEVMTKIYKITLVKNAHKCYSIQDCSWASHASRWQ